MLQAKRARDRNNKNKQNKSTTNTDSSNNTQQDYIPQNNIEQHYNIGFDNSYDDVLEFN